MGLILKALFSTSSTGLGHSKEIQGHSYDTSLPSNPPIKGRHPLLGNGPKLLSEKVLHVSKVRHHVQRYISTSGGSTTDSSGTYQSDTPHNVDTFESRSTISTSPINLKMDQGQRPWEKDRRWSRPTTSTSNVSSTPQRPTTGYIPGRERKKLHHVDSLPACFSSLNRLYSIDLLDAHSSIYASKQIILDREKASGTRSYGEDVADRNMAPELSLKRNESRHESRPLIDSPELKYLKEMHLANKRAIGMIDAELDRASTPVLHNDETEKLFANENQIEVVSHPHSHPLRSLLSNSDETHLAAISTINSDRIRAQSLSKPLPSKPLPSTPSLDENKLRDEIPSVMKLCSSKCSANRACTPESKLGSSITEPEKNSDSKTRIQKSRRYTCSSTTSYRRILPSSSQNSVNCQQNVQLKPCNNSLTTTSSNSSLKGVLGKAIQEMNNNGAIKGVLDFMDIVKNKSSEKILPASSEKGNMIDKAPAECDTIVCEPYNRESEQNMSSPKKHCSVSPVKHVASKDVTELKTNLDELVSSNKSPDIGKTRVSSLAYSRHGTQKRPSNYSVTQAPMTHFNRNRSMDQSENSSLHESQTISSLIDNPAESPIIAITREKGMVHEKFRPTSQKSTNLFNDKWNPILPSFKNYMNNEASSDTKYVWHLRPLTKDVKGPSKSFHGDVDISGVRKLSLSECYDSDNDEFSVLEEKTLGSIEENLIFREDSFVFDFSSRIPGIHMTEPFPITQSSVSQMV